MDPLMALEVSGVARLRAIAAAEADGDSEIQTAYRGTTAFITGASGFLGKHLLEKLLRSTDIKKVYLLLRPKKGRSVTERAKEIARDSIFEVLRKKKPHYADRFAAVAGDITELRLGMSDQDWDILTQEVNFIFHCAATTRFDETLTAATLTNVRGTREVLALAKDCKNLRALVHVSTAFSHATLSRRNKPVLEQFYDVPVPPHVLIEMAEKDGGCKLETVTHLLIRDWPNTYCLTKAVAEELVRSTSAGLPVCIVRPSIVISSYREPAPGWVDATCTYGPAGIMLGVGLGVVHTMVAEREVRIDVVPVDLVTNALVTAAWATRGGAGVTVYTVSNCRNATSWGACGDFHRTESRKISTPKAVWYCYCYDTSNRLVFWLLFWLLHYIPAYLMDGIGLLAGKPRRYVKLYTKAYKLFSLFSYFTTNEWRFSDKNLQMLQKSMSEKDREIFNCDVACVDWKEFMMIWCMGLRKYIIKDGLTGTQYAVKKQFWLRIANAVVLVLYAYFWWKVLSYAYMSARMAFMKVLVSPLTVAVLVTCAFGLPRAYPEDDVPVVPTVSPTTDLQVTTELQATTEFQTTTELQSTTATSNAYDYKMKRHEINFHRYDIRAVPSICNAKFLHQDCGKPVKLVVYYYKPGSRCEVGEWRGCLPNPNMFRDEFECVNTCIFSVRRTNEHIGDFDYGSGGD